jgi:4'-phosphopantetheinyl transferase
MLTNHGMSNHKSGSAITPDTVHIWSASLDSTSATVGYLSTLLSEDEMERADRFHFDHLRQDFIIAHGTLRLILAHYLDCPPQDIRFEYASYGKPFLSQPFAAEGISFNLSHSHRLTLYAIGMHRRLGIDIEHIRPLTDMLSVAANTFSKDENQQLISVAKPDVPLAFFNCWTRKEAFIKAVGEGVSFPLDQFDVTLKPNELAKLLSVRGSREEAERWSMFAWEPMDDYVAALVADGHKPSLILREWKHDERVQTLQEPR